MEETASAWENANAKEKEKENSCKERAIDIRRNATESLSGTRKQKENDATPRRQRRSIEVIVLLKGSVRFKKEQVEKEITLRQEELQ